MCPFINDNVNSTFIRNCIWYTFSPQSRKFINKTLIDKTDISKRLKYINIIIIKLIDSWLLTKEKHEILTIKYD